jgi:preprotein translocase subunit SecA
MAMMQRQQAAQQSSEGITKPSRQQQQEEKAPHNPALDGPRLIIPTVNPNGPGAKPRPNTVVGRNDPCPCGSGKKYKQCCGRLA